MTPRPSSPAWQLAVFLLVAILATLGIYRAAAHKADFRPTSQLPDKLTDLIAELRAANPEYIVIGDSMLTTRMDPAPLSALSGRRFYFYSRGGASTAAWYLYLKNAIIGSGIRPRAVIILFRNQYLTWPRFRVSGMYRANIDRVSQGDEPLVDRLLQPDPPPLWDIVGWARLGLTGRHGLFPTSTAASFYERKIENLALDLTSFGEKKDPRREKMSRRFDLASLRDDLANELPEEGTVLDNTEAARPRIFDPSPHASFLPHIVHLARQHHIPLLFFRVKCRPDTDTLTRQSTELQTYIAHLAAWLRTQGCLYYDETDDPSITLSMYNDGDHLSEAAKPWWTAYFWQRTRPLLP